MDEKMIEKDEFVRRFVKKMKDLGVDVAEFARYSNEAAEASFDEYKNEYGKGINDMTPEDWAEAEFDCWE